MSVRQTAEKKHTTILHSDPEGDIKDAKQTSQGSAADTYFAS